MKTFNKTGKLPAAMAKKKTSKVPKKTPKKDLDTVILGLTKSAIKRIIRHKTDLNISSGIYDTIRGEIQSHIRDMVPKLYAVLSTGSNTIQTKHVRAVTEGNYPTVYGEIDCTKCKKIDTPKRKNGKSKLVEKYQSIKHECGLVLPYTAFRRVVMCIAKDLHYSETRFSKKSILLMQFIIENYIFSLIEASAILAINRGSKTLKSSDIANTIEVGHIMRPFNRVLTSS